MPPLKKYTFEFINDSRTIIEIYTYEEISAIWKLEQLVKEPSNFKLK